MLICLVFLIVQIYANLLPVVFFIVKSVLTW